MPSRPTLNRLSGSEPFRGASTNAGNVLDFWQWATSDLLSNTQRGVLAEYLVASHLGVTGGVRTEWDAYDLTTKSGIRVEVKSAAYVQAWAQEQASQIQFGIAPSRAWNAKTGTFDTELRRQADVYVFALLAEEDRARVSPLDLDQWRFFVLPTSVLDARVPAQKTIALSRVIALGAQEVRFGEIADAVESAARPEPHHE